jgi:hypothetical protein
MSERAKPFVAWLGTDEPVPEGYSRFALYGRQQGGFSVPCVVTPLLPGDPKVGEVWLGHVTGKEYEITGAPFVGRDGRDFVVVRHDVGDGIVTRHLRMDELRPKPTLKTYRLSGESCGFTFEAESKEAALAKLAEALEEIPCP